MKEKTKTFKKIDVTSDHSGITLIALVITIIVMLILVGVTINVALNGGLFKTPKQAKADTQANIDAEQKLSNGRIKIGDTWYDSLNDYLNNNPSSDQSEVQGDYGGDYKPASELFDANAETLSAIADKNDFTTDGKLHIGDFINYDAGTWTADEISAIQTGKNDSLKTANGSNTALPTEEFQFGGFAAGDSRNGNAKPYSDSYNYIKDESGDAITGWRLFDLSEDSITLISAGCPEDYFHPYATNSGYMSEYILSGNVNSDADNSDLETGYAKRNWDIYKVGEATSAKAITKTDLDNWYKKYMDVTYANTYNDDSTFQKIYKTRYENLIDNYSLYWLASADSSSSVYNVYPGSRYMVTGDDLALGMRVLITLPSNVQLSKSGEETVASIANDENRSDKSYTYSVWNVK